uniref:Uncharacterized protein n=1 Tax=Equus asinus TaxID=9793 RepID=A0A9L0K5Y4_EQUAS
MATARVAGAVRADAGAPSPRGSLWHPFTAGRRAGTNPGRTKTTPRETQLRARRPAQRAAPPLPPPGPSGTGSSAPPPPRGHPVQDGGPAPPAAGVPGTGESRRAGSRGAGRGARGGERAGGGMAGPRGPALDVGAEPAEPSAAAGPACLPSVTRAQRAGGASGVCLLLAALCFGLAALYAPALLLRARKFALLLVWARRWRWRAGALLRGGAACGRLPARRGGAVAARAALRGRAGRHAVRGAGPAQHGAHGAGRMRAGGRPVGAAPRPAALGHGLRAASRPRAAGLGRPPRQGAARVRGPGTASRQGRGAGRRARTRNRPGERTRSRPSGEDAVPTPGRGSGAGASCARAGAQAVGLERLSGSPAVARPEAAPGIGWTCRDADDELLLRSPRARTELSGNSGSAALTGRPVPLPDSSPVTAVAECSSLATVSRCLLRLLESIFPHSST